MFIKKNKMMRSRKGFSLVELLIAVVVLGILSAMLIAAGTASQNKARVAVAMNDLDSFKNATYKMLMTHPDVMKYRDDKPSDSIKKIVGFINEEVDESFQLSMTSDHAKKSGACAYTTNLRDPWGNPYGVYIYTDTNTSGASDSTGAAIPDHCITYTGSDRNFLKESDSCVYIVFASAGKNGTGGPMGIDGANFNATTGRITAGANMINNSDGIDDLGLIVRILNGSTYTATFGSDTSTLGALKEVQWIYGVPHGTPAGICYDYKTPKKMTASEGGSIDEFPDFNKATETGNAGAPYNAKVAGTWAVAAGG